MHLQNFTIQTRLKSNIVFHGMVLYYELFQFFLKEKNNKLE